MKRTGKVKEIVVVLAACAAATTAQAERDHLMIVGSSTVYPFSTLVAEQFARTGEFSNPTVESTGTGGGIKLFCKGIGTGTPDIANASRRMKKSEYDLCQENGVKGIVEVLIGYDGIVIANAKSAAPMELSLRDLYLALAKDIPDPSGAEKFIPNPHRKWSDVNPELPDIGIRVFGPPPTSGTRDAFAELALEGGCKAFGWVSSMRKSDKKEYKARCHSIREDGLYVEAGENDNLIIQKLVADEDALGIFGFGFLDQNLDKVRGSKIDGHMPEFEMIASGAYPVSRPLYFYVKRAHLDAVPGMQEYVNEFISERTIGADGYLLDRGLIPTGAAIRAQYKDGVASIQSVTL